MKKNNNDKLNLTINSDYDIMLENDGNISVSGYLLRYSNPQDKKDRDLDRQYWTPKTYLMTETYPIKGAPIMYQHSLEREFSRVGIGIVNYVKEDEIGVFIKGQLHNRSKWVKIVQEVNRRRSLGLSIKKVKELADIAYNNIKSVVSEIPLKFSMGSYPPTFSADKETGEIISAGIVDVTITPTPSEPLKTDALITMKSFMETFEELESKESSTDDYKRVKQNLKNFLDKTEKINKMDKIKQIFAKYAQEMFDALDEEAKTNDNIEMSEGDEGVIKSYISELIKEHVEKDTGYKKSFANASEETVDLKALNELVEEVVESNVESILGTAVKTYMDEQNEKRSKLSGAAKSVFDSFARNTQENPKSASVGNNNLDADKTRKSMSGIEVTQPEVGSLGDFFRDVYQGRNPHHDYTKSIHENMKSQNPYIGTLGGFLQGQEMSQTILDPLRPEVVMFGMGVKETRINNAGIYTVPKMTTVPSAYRPGINDQITDSEGKYDTITAMLRPLAARVVIPRQMLMTTGTNMEEQLRREIIRSLRLQIDKEILEGVGNVAGTGNTGAEIRGIKRVLEGSNLTSHVNTLATNGRKPKYEDLIDAETTVASANVELDSSTSGWVMHPRDRGTFRRTTDSTGQPLLYPNYSERPYEDLIGYRVATTTQIDNAQTTGTSTDTSDIYFGNYGFSEYVVGNDIEVILDDMTLADQLQVRFIVYLYSDFVVHYPEAFYLMKGVRA